MEQQKKNRDPEFWLMRRRNGQAPSAATSAIFKAEAEGRVLTGGSGSLVQSAGQSLGPGGRRLKAVDKDSSDLFGENENGESRRRKKEDSGEGDMDEMLFDEEFADDDEGEGVDNEDEEAKELEVSDSFDYFALLLHRSCVAGTAQEGVQECQQAARRLCG
jgi:transcription initiation factor TFIIF subunit alpha